MAEYKAFEDNIEAKGAAAMPFIISGSLGKEQRIGILKKNGIEDLDENGWYDLQSVLNSFKTLSETVGEMNLFLIGKTVTEKAPFPPMDGLENALRSIDIAYHMNHRKNGEIMFNPETGKMLEGIGHYHLKSFDSEKREAIMVCHTPYPSKFEEGLVMQIVRMFKPKDSLKSKVVLDTTKETRAKGGDTCTFVITW